MQYFKHMSTMRNDKKIRRLINKYGLEGYGLYCLIIESITEKLSTESPIPTLDETCEDLAEFYNGNTAKIDEMVRFMVNQDLFEIDTISGRVTCLKIFKFLETNQTRSEAIRSLIKSYKDTVSLPPPLSKTPSEIVSDKSERLEQTKTRTDQEERIIFKSASEEISEDIFKPVRPTEPPKAKRRTVDVAEFDQVLESWDKSGVLPEYRLRRGNIGSADTAPVFDSMSLFTADEIQEAVQNYIALKSDLAKYKPFGYATPITFLTKGIAAHLNQSNPFENFAIQRGKQNSQPTIPKFGIVQTKKPEPRICPKCGKPENVQLTVAGQPWCHECFGWHFDHNEAM